MNPFLSLFSSRKFLLLIFDVISSLAIYFVGKYAGAAIEDLRFVIAVLQPLWLLVVGAIAVQNVAGIKATGSLAEAVEYNKPSPTVPSSELTVLPTVPHTNE